MACFSIPDAVGSRPDAVTHIPSLAAAWPLPNFVHSFISKVDAELPPP